MASSPWLLAVFSLVFTSTSVSGTDVHIVTVEGTRPATGPSNCIPFGSASGNPSWGQYSGFVYQSVPSFVAEAGDWLAFDLGAANDESIILSIAMAATTTNGGVSENGAGFTTVCSKCTAASKGNNVTGDFELGFQLEQGFNFSGGGLM